MNAISSDNDRQRELPPPKLAVSNSGVRSKSFPTIIPKSATLGRREQFPLVRQVKYSASILKLSCDASAPRKAKNISAPALMHEGFLFAKCTEFEASGKVAKIAVLFTIGYLFENRETADTKELTLRLRSLLFGIRKEAF